MDILLYTGLFILSLGGLLKASDWFVDSAETIGLSLGASPFLIGVTIVAFGTSLPELATSIASVGAGDSKIVISNVVGSNITNIALVLGFVIVVVREMRLDYNVWHNDMPFLWGSAFLLWLTVRDQNLTLVDAAILAAGIVIFLSFSVQGDNEEGEMGHKATWKTWLFLLLGGVGVWLGAEYTIVAIIELAKQLPVGSDEIALTAVALGTSLPEVIVSLNAARKGKTSMVMGNVLGSNIFNTYVVLSITRLFGPLEIPSGIVHSSLPLMIIMTILFGIISNDRNLSRWEGLLLLLFYVYFLLNTLGLA